MTQDGVLPSAAREYEYPHLLGAIDPTCRQAPMCTLRRLLRSFDIRLAGPITRNEAPDNSR